MIIDIVISVVLLVVGIATLLVIHVCVVARLFGAGFRNRTLAHRFGAAQYSRVLSIKLNRLPFFDYYVGGSYGANGSGGAESAVCLEIFMAGDKGRLLPICRHSFHVHCIDSWLLKMPVCPICGGRIENDATRGAKEGSVKWSVVDSCSSLGGHVVHEGASG